MIDTHNNAIDTGSGAHINYTKFICQHKRALGSNACEKYGQSWINTVYMVYYLTDIGSHVGAFVSCMWSDFHCERDIHEISFGDCRLNTDLSVS